MSRSGKLQPELIEFMAYVNSGKRPDAVDAIRHQAENTVALMKADEPVDIALVEERKFDSNAHHILVRIYDPKPEQKKPLIIYYHGGGHVSGSLNTHDNIGRRIADKTQCAVMSVDYRLAPEHKYPHGLNDCIAAFEKRTDILLNLNIDCDQVILAGDSAGGNLALSVMNSLIDKKIANAVKGLVLLYPGTDFTMDGSHESIDRFADGYLLTKSYMAWLFEQYFEAGANHKTASPLYTQHASQFPPVYMIVAECDPLRDEGVAMAMKLQEAGVKVTLEEYSGLVHAFMHFEKLVPNQIDSVLNGIEQLCQKYFTK